MEGSAGDIMVEDINVASRKNELSIVTIHFERFGQFLGLVRSVDEDHVT